jgi:hypothetical protein
MNLINIFEQTPQEIIIIMANGNPGAITFILKAMEIAKEIDPESAWNFAEDNDFPAYGPLINADRCDIYGTDLYVLWNDICDRSIINSIALLRATQLGILDHNILKDACSRQDYSGKSLINVEDIYKKVCEELPSFDSINRIKK